MSLATVLVLLAALAVSAFFLFIVVLLVWWLDRYDREPLHLVAMVFLWGASAAPLGAVTVFPLLDIVAGGIEPSPRVALVSIGLLTPMIEEVGKALGIVLVVVFSSKFDNPTDGVVYGTADGGVTWAELLRVSLPDQNAVVMAVLISPHDPNLMLATVREESHVYRSTDGGATWAEAAVIPGVHMGSLAAHGTDPQVLYAGTGCIPHTWGPCEVYRSGDAGLTWSPVLTEAGGLVGFAQS